MDEQPYPADRLLFMAQTHQKVIDYYNYVLEELRPSDAERSRIVADIQREEKALAEIEKLGVLNTRAARFNELPADLGLRLLRAIEEP
jgi:hypothetical protein